MQISVRLSAALAQVTGAPRVQVTVVDGATVADVLQGLTTAYPSLAPRLRHAVPILGGKHATASDLVTADQELAFLMPVAGGDA